MSRIRKISFCPSYTDNSEYMSKVNLLYQITAILCKTVC